jgi:putative transposase
MPDVVAGMFKSVLRPKRREFREPAVHGTDPLPGRVMRSMIPRGDKQFLETPWYGSRQMARHMQRRGHKCGRHRVRRLMRLMRLVPIYQTPNTSKNHPQHKIYPYLLRGLTIDRQNQVWCVDITYIPLRRGFLYLVAIMDWYSQKVLSWRLSNSMEADFCPLGRLLCNRLLAVVEALKEAMAWHGTREIMNSDQGSQFTGFEWIQALNGPVTV